MAYTKIATIAPTSTASSVDFTSIPQTYKHLELRIAFSATNDATNNLTLLRINGLSTGIYSGTRTTGNDAGIIQKTRLNAENYAYPWDSSGILYYPGIYAMYIANYASSSYKKNITCYGGYTSPSNGSKITFMSSVLANTTAAITSISFFENATSYRANQAIFTLYGMD